MSNTRYNGNGEERSFFCKLVTIVARQSDITPSAANYGHYIKMAFYSLYPPELIAYCLYCLVALKQGWKEQMKERIIPGICLNHFQKVYVPFARFNESSRESLRKERKF